MILTIYINDIYYFLLPKKYKLYFNDTSLFTQDKTIHELSSDADMLESRAELWFLANKLFMNKEKTQKITITTNHKISTGII